MRIVLDLTERETETLIEALEDYCDCGPFGEGWRSDELKAVSEKASKAAAEQDLNKLQRVKK